MPAARAAPDDDHPQYLLADGTRTLAGAVILSGPSMTVPDGWTLGQADGPLLTFDDANNYLGVTGCKVGFGTATPAYIFTVESASSESISLTTTGADTTPQLRLINDAQQWTMRIAGAFADVFQIRDVTNATNPFQIEPGATTDALYIDSTGNIGLLTPTPTISDGVGLHIAGKILRIGTAKTPASSGATGNAGEICWDANYI